MSGPAVAADPDGVGTFMVGTAGDQTAHPGSPHFFEGDLFCSFHHEPSFAPSMAGEERFFTFTQFGDRPVRAVPVFEQHDFTVQHEEIDRIRSAASLIRGYLSCGRSG